MKHKKMKKKRFIIPIAIIVALIFTGTVCLGIFFQTRNNKNLSVTLCEGEYYSLSDLADNNSKIKVKDDSILSLCDDNAVTAIKTGRTSVTIKNGLFEKHRIDFTILNAPKKISMKESIVLNKGATEKLNAICTSQGHNIPLSYSSDNESVATIDHNGAISAKEVGECEIKATAYNGISATCKITVITLPDSFELLDLDKYSVGTDINVIPDTEHEIPPQYITTTVSDNNVLWVDSENPLRLHAASSGQADITVTLPNGASATKSVTVGEFTGNFISDFKILNQFPTLPTGCEVVSLTSVLNYYGMDVSMTTMADEYMPRSSEPYYNVDPDEYFVGSTPYTWDGFGCYPGCIVKTANNYFSANNIEDYKVVNITGCSVDDVFNYIENGVPVITWGTSNFATPRWDAYWFVGGKKINWCNYEHCLVTVGYDKNSGVVTLGDDSGGYNREVSLEQYKVVFEGMGNMAVVVLPK